MPESEESELIWYLHNFISTYPNIKPVIHFNTPFYTSNRWLIYLSLQKKGGIEVCFVQARYFSNHLELLDFKKRKQVAGITFKSITEINLMVLDDLISEALRVDNGFKKN